MAIRKIRSLDLKQLDEFKSMLGSLHNICVCTDCKSLIEFDDKDIDRTKKLPHVWCICGHEIQLHSKYYLRYNNNFIITERRLYYE